MISNIPLSKNQLSGSGKISEIRYRADAAGLKERFQTEARENSLYDNSVTLKTDISLSSLKSQEKSADRDNPNPYSAFFSDALTVSKDSTDYMIGGTRFSEADYSRAKRVLNAAADSLCVGSGRNTDIDYRGYAEMSLASNCISTWAHDNLTHEQASAVEEAFFTHSSVLKERQAMLLNSGCFTGESESTDCYYGVKRIISKEELESLSDMLSNDIPGFRGLKKTVSADRTAATQIATNQTLIKDLEKLFAEADLHASSPLKNLKDTYAKMMAPAFDEYGIRPDYQINMVNSAFDSFSNIIGRINVAASEQKLSENV